MAKTTHVSSLIPVGQLAANSFDDVVELPQARNRSPATGRWHSSAWMDSFSAGVAKPALQQINDTWVVVIGGDIRRRHSARFVQQGQQVAPSRRCRSSARSRRRRRKFARVGHSFGLPRSSADGSAAA
uniref:Uncharacterized protein n=1 Tax=Globodera rostochiensis TaxID=31243 RepID=A0A914HQC2_GLORO